LYVSLTQSGARLTMLRYNASSYLKQIAENITWVNNTVVLSENVTLLLGMFMETMDEVGKEEGTYEEIQEDLDEYEFFDEER